MSTPLPVRSRDAALSEALEETRAQIARTDTKASMLLALVGAVFAGVLAVGGSLDLSAAALIPGALGAVVLAGAGEALLSVVRPRLTPVAKGWLLDWASLTPERLRQEITTDHRPEAVTVLARQAVAKHKRLQRAVDLIRAAGVLLAIAALIAAGGAW
ncbi:DUF5706 domain-containing protein [Streptomyces sp. DSM 44917]|uniref:DUF5706 domain-containing protein n=1 Tax=Streptomyces boetiae TaxID=3075541 RepID=A0ABU2L682_9ACTN|nr:Pycsar system effector family protein [Streptomyces sp. DSM 44917]MDT0307017.1 DUF5706 domain-containing protein [Streptomyces sp. DSM 44917]